MDTIDSILEGSRFIRDVLWNMKDISVRKAIGYISPHFTVKATRQKKSDRRDRQETFVVTIGKPNYAERAFIKTCIKAKEPFPVKKIQLKYWPKKK